MRERHLFAELVDLEVDGVVPWLSDNEVCRGELADCFRQNLPLVALGNGIPADLSIVGADDIPLAPCLPVSLTSIRQRCRRTTRAAA